jgi:hypothetical protein
LAVEGAVVLFRRARTVVDTRSGKLHLKGDWQSVVDLWGPGQDLPEIRDWSWS